MNQKEVNDLCERKPTESQTVVELQSALRRIDILEAKLLASEAVVAELKDVLSLHNERAKKEQRYLYIATELHGKTNKALSTTCGTAFLAERERHVKALEFCKTHNHADNNHGKIPCLGHECRVCDAISTALNRK